MTCARFTCLLLSVAAGGALLQAQTCNFSIGALNRARGATGAIHVECPGSMHTAPFGNWGASSAFGSKRNGHQFDGWCRNKWVCDNNGRCKTDCTDQWYEWNSCTDVAQYKPPNCSLYNAQSCTEQRSATDVNVLGTYYGPVTASCPYDTNGDGYCDAGGCKDFPGVYLESGYMSVYELDPVCCDELIQTVYFPATWIPLTCTPWACPATGSQWVNPNKYDSPASPAKLRAQFAIATNYSVFSDPNRVCATYAQVDPRYNCR